MLIVVIDFKFRNHYK